MCFSATASFSIAAVTAGLGIATLRHVRQPRDYFLAAVPLLFASQQAVEGVLWLQFSGGGDGGAIATLSLGFLIFAEVLWPAYSAFAVLMVEPERRRRQVLYGLVLAGTALSIYLLAALLGEPPVAVIRNDSIAYSGEPLSWWQLPYLLCVGLPLLISSHRAIRIFGAVVLAGFAASAYAYVATYISVWCFFAAAGSTVLYRYFEQAAAALPLRQS